MPHFADLSGTQVLNMEESVNLLKDGYAPAPMLPFGSEGDATVPKRPLPCECPEVGPEEDPTHFFRDPHPGGWCRSCGKVVSR